MRLMGKVFLTALLWGFAWGFSSFAITFLATMDNTDPRHLNSAYAATLVALLAVCCGAPSGAVYALIAELTALRFKGRVGLGAILGAAAVLIVLFIFAVKHAGPNYSFERGLRDSGFGMAVIPPMAAALGAGLAALDWRFFCATRKGGNNNRI